MNAFLGGLLHPLLLPAHALALLALGFLTAQQRAQQRPLSIAAFVIGLAVGLAAIAFAIAETPAGDVLLALTALAGLLVALGRPMPALVCAPLAAAAGAALALDSPPEAISISVARLTLIGTGVGAGLALALIALGVSYVVGAQQSIAPRIGIRILGSWIAASAILVLTLRLSRGQLL